MVFDEATLKRFWSKIERLGPDDCWVWHGTNIGRGYGTFSVYKKPYLAHRFSLIVQTGINPPSMMCLHACNNRKCCNPNHLRWGTGTDNAADRKTSPYWLAFCQSDKARANGRRLGQFGHQNGAMNGKRCRKLTAEQVGEVRKLAALGHSQTGIGRMYGVGQMTVSRILKGKRYADV